MDIQKKMDIQKTDVQKNRHIKKWTYKKMDIQKIGHKLFFSQN